MLTARCRCGAVQVEVPRRPRAIPNCNCSIWRRPGDVRIRLLDGAARWKSSTDGITWR